MGAYLWQYSFSMGKSDKAFLLMNLGSPDSTKVKDVKRYLNQFLMDGRVIDYPYLLRSLLVKGIIIPFRAKKSAAAYQSIWTSEGSPLICNTRRLQQALQNLITEPVEIAMRYGNPTPGEAFRNILIKDPGIKEVIAVPLYPHYAMSSFETAVESARSDYSKGKYPFKIKFLKPFYNNPGYIKALCESIKPFLETNYDHLLFSYHGIPERHIKKSDTTGCHCLKMENCCEIPSSAHLTCYRHQVRQTTFLVTKELGIPESKFSISFQSRLGKGWLQPFTDIRLEQMPSEGIKNLLVICPAFVSDCLETLEEIQERGMESFLKSGGEQFNMIPCLNTHPEWVKALQEMIMDPQMLNS